MISTAIKYLGVGLLQFGLDWTLFVVLEGAGVPVTPANVVSRLVTASIGFQLNKRLTFAARSVKPIRMAARYWAFWGVMTLISSVLLCGWTRWTNGPAFVGVGKFLVEALLCIVGFFISKFWVYKDVPR